MKLKLKNIGIIKNAEIKIDGLTIIAGENDTGKSTIGKILLTLIKSEKLARDRYFRLKRKNRINTLDKYFFKERLNSFIRISNLLFKNELKTNSKLINLNDKESIIKFKIGKNKFIEIRNKTGKWEFSPDSITIEDEFPFIDATFVQSPIIWDLYGFFTSVLQMKTQVELEEEIKFRFEYPYTLWDLYGKLIKKRIDNISSQHKDITEKIANIINGRFVKKLNTFVFKRNNVEISLVNVAYGIKSFGILQVLLENGYLSRKSLLIFDEPEVHLHPKWEIKFAEILIELAKMDIKILINTHSPYMLEALKRYAEKEKIDNITN
jgi:predicted ATPase